jgi:hypothetical protein
MVKLRKRRAPPGGEWVLLAGRFGERMWTAVAYTVIGEPIAAAINASRADALRAAMAEALGRARPTRVLVAPATGDDGVVAALGVPSEPLGDEQEELVARFAEEIASGELDAEVAGP